MIKLYLKNHPAVEEQERQRAHKQRMQQQQQQQQRAALWLLDGPSTSSAAARAAATALSATAGDAGAGAGACAASSAGISEINYFAKVLCEKLEHCFDAVAGAGAGADAGIDNSPLRVDTAYCQLVCRFVAALHEVCCRSRHKDALQSVFRLVLAESALLDKYCNFLTMDQWRKATNVDGHVGAGAGYDGLETSVVVDECCRRVSLGQALQLQLEVLKLLSAMKLLDPVVMLQLLKQQKQNALQQQQHAQQMATNKERLKWYDNMQRTLLSEICQQNPYARDWSTQQVRQLLDLGGATFLNFLITENFELISDLCEVAAAQATHEAAGELDALWLNALLQHASALNKHSIRALPPLLLRLCNASWTSVAGCNLQMALLSLQLLQRLHARHNNARALQVRLERLARRLVFSCSAAPLQRQQLVQQLTELAGDRLTAIGTNNSSTTFWQQLLLDTQECKPAAQPLASLAKEQQQQQQLQQRIIDEKWLLSQAFGSIQRSSSDELKSFTCHACVQRFLPLPWNNCSPLERYMLASTLTVDQPERSLQLQLDQLLVHVMKILNIYYHLITQQKPQLFVKVQKSDLFANAKELALVQSVGYFGSDYIYIKLYNILRSANDSYKITINQESGRLLISLLRTCLNTLGLCIELRAHTTPTPTPAGTPTGHTPSHGRQRGHSPGSSGADTASNTGAGGGGSSSATAVFPTNATLKIN
ncbi:uncharacterized protein LOC120771212 [Bactrocera tryoni]|uniref:uncharacterized protein LOC120771212 n=1 Tax=Bactrocera tryoni TaxID=59916 RepID=UPI001A959B0D|nr:uncharacterized protein LOC120771212 [Bactrocera tryoni]